jgi:hypothetical protein
MSGIFANITSETINVSDYWPWVPVSNVFDGGIVLSYTPTTGGMRMRQMMNGAWSYDWFYRNDPTRGVLEYEDDYPKTTWFQNLMFWTSIVAQPCVTGKEIVWGGIQKIGDSVGAQCETVGIFGQYGWQELSFDAILPSFVTPAGTFTDVLVMRYWQSWSGQPPKGAQMWLAKGLGPIKQAWTLNGVPTGFGITLQSTSSKGLVA